MELGQGVRMSTLPPLVLSTHISVCSCQEKKKVVKNNMTVDRSVTNGKILLTECTETDRTSAIQQLCLHLLQSFHLLLFLWIGKLHYKRRPTTLNYSTNNTTIWLPCDTKSLPEIFRESKKTDILEMFPANHSIGLKAMIYQEHKR